MENPSKIPWFPYKSHSQINQLGIAKHQQQLVPSWAAHQVFSTILVLEAQSARLRLVPRESAVAKGSPGAPRCLVMEMSKQSSGRCLLGSQAWIILQSYYICH